MQAEQLDAGTSSFKHPAQLPKEMLDLLTREKEDLPDGPANLIHVGPASRSAGRALPLPWQDRCPSLPGETRNGIPLDLSLSSNPNPFTVKA